MTQPTPHDNSRRRSRTSLTDPLRIDAVPVSPSGHFAGGLIGLTFCPGKKAPASLMGGQWDRDLDIDLDAVAAWQAVAVVTLIEDAELDALQVRGLGAGVQARGMAWHHLPIVDGNRPDHLFEGAWATLAPTLLAHLREGRRVLVHCKGGLGRAGTVAARLLIELGMVPELAMRCVRQHRTGAIETRTQEQYLLAMGARQ